ncbi:MAG: peptidoglycan-binding protein [Clostridia bacterium]|nr:peptidoglycan-binding protein [Clostridia bacterium]
MTTPGARLPVIPEYITVHLGRPNSDAPNVTVPFLDYVANVASSEIYPTWPESAIRANMYAQISFALNRIYTEYYRSRGYDFDITNSTAFDQYYVNGREIFSNIYELAGELFNNYVVRQGSVEPLFTQYCNGTTVTCNGLSQWGTVALARQGLSPYEILQYYFGDNIDLIRNAPIENVTATAPTVPLRLGSANNDVLTLQIRLNRIGRNYPAIPKIVDPDGQFSYDTEAAVRAFQRIAGLDPDGVVGNATWYTVLRYFNAVKRLNELDSEGLTIEEVTQEFPEVLSRGSTGIGVENLQYYINYLSDYYPTIPRVSQDGIFGADTENAVIEMQRTFGLVPDGVVGELTWQRMYNAYLGIVSTIPLEYLEGSSVPYPGVPLRIGSEGEDVSLIQRYLSRISRTYTAIPSVSVTGYYGNQTQSSVRAFQEYFGLSTPNGTVNAVTWDAISNIFDDVSASDTIQAGQYPGYEVT